MYAFDIISILELDLISTLGLNQISTLRLDIIAFLLGFDTTFALGLDLISVVPLKSDIKYYQYIILSVRYIDFILIGTGII